MVVINGVVFAIVPKDDAVARLMQSFDPGVVELFREDSYCEGGTQRRGEFGISLDAAEEIFGGRAVWVCPD